MNARTLGGACHETQFVICLLFFFKLEKQETHQMIVDLFP
jgi:hypothetical protein